VERGVFELEIKEEVGIQQTREESRHEKQSLKKISKMSKPIARDEIRTRMEENEGPQMNEQPGLLGSTSRRR
jgi:hypothetical protein